MNQESSATYVAVILLSLMSCVTVYFGVALALWLRENARALAAGAMIFVSVHELAPMAKRYHHPDYFALGIVLSALVYELLAAMTVGLATS